MTPPLPFANQTMELNKVDGGPCIRDGAFHILTYIFITNKIVEIRNVACYNASIALDDEIAG